MITYNHEQFIAQAVESVMMQITDFDIELVIGEDCSTDKTLTILNGLKKRYINKIHIVSSNKNVGPQLNFTRAFAQCKGKYIALLEGDDYWIDPLKIQKQVEFLEDNPEYAICFTRVYELVNNKKVISPENPWNLEKTFTIYDLSLSNFMHTNSVVFKNGLIEGFPDWFYEASIGDYIVHLFNAKKGWIKYLPEITGVYRKFTGTWSSQEKPLQIKKVLYVLRKLLEEDFDTEVKRGLRIHMEALQNEYFSTMLDENNFSYLEDMDMLLSNSSPLVRQWMMNIYPNKIKQLLNSKPYRIANYLKKIIRHK
jgi:glycosyltransferase involved in cell wall biosynthesis